MAKNTIFTNCSTITLQVPSGTAPGDPVLIGGIKGLAEAVFDSSMTAVAVTTDGNGFATIRIAPSSVALMSVLASTDDTSSPLGGASAVNLGDSIYKNDSSEILSKDSSGTKLWGYALGTRAAATGAYPVGSAAIGAGLTASIEVLIAS